jgi:hypothetical protein
MVSQAESMHARTRAGGDEQLLTAQLAPVVDLEDVLFALVARSDRVRGQDELDALAAQCLSERLTQRRRHRRDAVHGVTIE